jgi:hypothetical protein
VSAAAGSLAGMSEPGRIPDEVDIAEDDVPGEVVQPWQDPGVYEDEDQPDTPEAGDPDHPDEPAPDTGV